MRLLHGTCMVRIREICLHRGVCCIGSWRINRKGGLRHCILYHRSKAINRQSSIERNTLEWV